MNLASGPAVPMSQACFGVPRAGHPRSSEGRSSSTGEQRQPASPQSSVERHPAAWSGRSQQEQQAVALGTESAAAVRIPQQQRWGPASMASSTALSIKRRTSITRFLRDSRSDRKYYQPSMPASQCDESPLAGIWEALRDCPGKKSAWRPDAGEPGQAAGRHRGNGVVASTLVPIRRQSGRSRRHEAFFAGRAAGGTS